jgi:hypothetical protein
MVRMESILESDLIGMSLEQEGLVITFACFSCGILFEGAASKDVVMLTLDDMKCRLLVADQSLEICI